MGLRVESWINLCCIDMRDIIAFESMFASVGSDWFVKLIQLKHILNAERSVMTV